MATTIFGDAWFRVSGMRVALLETVQSRRHVHLDRAWYVLHDTYSQRFFKASEEAHAFILKLNTAQTVEEVWDAYVQSHPHAAPSQEEVIQLLSQLHASNLLHFTEQADNAAIVERYRKQRRREKMGQVASFLFFKVPLWNPDRWLSRIQPLIRATTGLPAMLLWAAVVLAGVLAALSDVGALHEQGQGLLSMGNLPWLYICMGGMKLIHETLHGFVCKRYGGEVRGFGLMFLLFTPLPYMDATSAWGFTNRWHRMYVGFAGMAAELFMAAIGALVWSQTGPGAINSLAFNVMVIGSVSSLLFNGNPLLRFDAYYILSDFAQIPNLYAKGQQQWRYLLDRWVLGTTDAQCPAEDRREWWWLTVYGALSFVYLLIVMLGMSLVLLDMWFPVGVLALTMTIVSRFVMPGHKLVRHLASGRTQPNRLRAVGTVLALAGVAALLVFQVPLPASIQARGVLEAQNSTLLYAPSEGLLVEQRVPNGAQVQAGQVLAVMHNRDLELEIDAVAVALREADAHLRAALFRAPNELAPVRQQMQATQERLQELQRRRQELVLVAPHAGEWVAPTMHERQGSWIARGQQLGELVDRSAFRFMAVIAQEQADRLFGHSAAGAELRLVGQAEHLLQAAQVTLVPYQQVRLRSAALGWLGGGDIAVRTDQPQGDMARDPFFVVFAELPAARDEALSAYHGMSGVLRIALPRQPLSEQLHRSFMQLVQKRYAL
jgi:putative peptide zinc metalloprotease protein